MSRVRFHFFLLFLFAFGVGTTGVWWCWDQLVYLLVGVWCGFMYVVAGFLLFYRTLGKEEPPK